MGVIGKNRGTQMFGGVGMVPLSTTTVTTDLEANTLYFSTGGRPFYFDSTGVVLLSSL